MSAVVEELERKRFLGFVLGASVNSPATMLEQQWQQEPCRAEAQSLHTGVYYVTGSFPACSASYATGSLPIRSVSYVGGSLFHAPALSQLPATAIARFYSHHEPRDPFDQLRDGKAAAANALIDRWKHDEQITDTLVSRLRELIEMAREEYPDTEIPGVQMLESALGFFRSRHDVLEPLLALTSGGHLWAQWQQEPNYAAALEFRRDGSVNLAAFFPDQDEPLRPASIAGNYSWKAAAREVRRNPALQWLVAT